MKRTLTVTEAASRLPSLLDEVRRTKEAVVIVGDSGDEAVLVGAGEYRQIERMKERAWDLVKEIRERNADFDSEEIYRDVTRVVDEVRQEEREQQEAQTQGRN